MTIIVGLGNPGQKYCTNRHNIGFRVLNEFQKENGFPDFGLKKKFNSLISKGKIGRKKIVLGKPQTFMNNSGRAVKALIFNFQFSPHQNKFGAGQAIFNQFSTNQSSNLIVVHDDIDLPLGKIKISKGRGSGGHKGIESVVKELKTKNFIRVRIGIAPVAKFAPKTKNKVQSLEKFVLKDFTKKEEKKLKEIIKRTCLALKTLIEKGVEKAMNEFNE